ncbi:carbohydrate-binding protein SusD [Reichenbachiella sp. 5M10]|uniref:RagB/SusD family nutrient uptake outer membrane protein n=1 Tax=Reichenbachiella sp. 5M10 TaxID=1889772 RepID=UPI000C145D8D|nr:RagB/SusD family nutrient uptake outer membrane protein [Reichenbachiella sp. 5M10]PIB36007.1 carbohydrate-binding protein SusD [Reichenbachiella sp. 5M10]
MKKILLISLIAMSTLSCDEFLDIQPVGQVIPVSVEEYRSFLTTAYAIVPDHKVLMTYRTDELLLTENSAGIAYYEDIYLWRDDNPSLLTTPYPYASFYTVIFYANHVINSTEDIIGEQEEIEQLVGEAYGLRALNYFELVNMYGAPYDASTADSELAVPIVTTYDSDRRYFRETTAAVYQLINEDITMAESLLQVARQEPGYNYRFSIAALKSLKARVALYMQDWKTAIEASHEALSIQGDLLDLNESHEVMPCEYNSEESILALQEVTSVDILQNASISEYLINTYNQSDDLRFDEMYRVSGSGYSSKKSSGSNFKSTFRTADLYLMLAEANAHLGGANLQTSKSALLTLAQNRYTPQGYTDYQSQIESMNQQQLLDEVLQERLREFALEGHRWYDIRRTNSTTIDKIFEGEAFTLNVEDTRYTLPFPQDATINNPDL